MRPQPFRAPVKSLGLASLLSTTVLSGGLFLATPAFAQSSSTPPPRQIVDARGVDVAAGKAIVSTPPARIADAQFALAWNGAVGQNSLEAFIKGSGTGLLNREVYIGGNNKIYGGRGKTFIPDGSGGYVSQDQDGSKLEF